MNNRDIEAVLKYHENTKHSELSVRGSQHMLDWDNQPASFKVYRNLEPIPLLRDLPDAGVPALEAIAWRWDLRDERNGRNTVVERQQNRLIQKLLVIGTTPVPRIGRGVKGFCLLL